MLKLTRKISEKLRISDNITVTVLGIRGCQVRLGISAPRHVSVLREELIIRAQKARKNEVKRTRARKRSRPARDEATATTPHKPRGRLQTEDV
jgi:carbon storage regulator